MKGRSLAGYLALPRPGDLLFKGLFVPSAYVAGRLGTTSNGVAVGAALVAWMVFEYGLYQARYTVNDLIDLEVDQRHRAACWRGRAPHDPRVWRWGTATLAVRLATSALVVLLLPGAAQRIIGLGALGLAGSAICYEVARAPARRRSPPTDRSASLRWSRSSALVFCLVGSGSALRCAFGMALAGAPATVVLTGTAFGWVFGTMLVLGPWALEGAWLEAAGDETTLVRKPHVALLARLVPDGGASTPGRSIFAGPPARLIAGLFAVTSALAVALGATMDRSPRPTEAIVLLGVWALLGPLVVAWRQSFWAGALLAALDVGAAAMLVGGPGRPAMIALAVIVSVPTATSMPTLQRFLDQHPAPAPTLGSSVQQTCGILPRESMTVSQ